MKGKAFIRGLSSLLAAAVGFGALQIPVSAAQELENTAADFVVTAPDAESGHPASNLTDGDVTTLYVRNGGTWPTEIVFAKPEGKDPLVKKVEVFFESGHSAWTVDVKLSHVVNNVVSDPIVDFTADDHNFDNVFTYTFDDPASFTDLRVELSDPKNDGSAGAFWPALAEVKIWTVKEGGETEESSLVNVAPAAAVTSVGGTYGTPANLVDEDYSTMYGFFKGTMSQLPEEGAWINLSLDQEYTVEELEAAFENTDPDPNNFEFVYDIYGKSASDSDYALLVENGKATRLDDGHIQRHKLNIPTVLKDVKILLKAINCSAGTPWPAMTEFKVLAQPVEAEITDNLALNKSVHSNTNASNAGRVTDGKTSTTWVGATYPAYLDIDLEANYDLSEITVVTPSTGYTQYSIYTSLNGRDFDRVARKESTDSCPATGEAWSLENKAARYVRVYVEYNSAATSSQVSEVIVQGKASSTPAQDYPALVVEDYEGSAYDVEVTDADTIEEVYGIIDRQLSSKYRDWFTLELAQSQNGNDYFNLSAKNGKVHIQGNSGVSLAMGLNHYLKYFCNVHIAQEYMGSQTTMPESIVLPEQPIHQETAFPVRYSYNYCTLSYSMAFWGEAEWRHELDWLALNGVNVVLDATGTEEVFRRFLSATGYSHQEIKDFIAGPAYYAWFYMNNMASYGGPIHDNWFVERTDLARKNHLIMRKLGMQPVLQGYSGLVPSDFKSKNPNVTMSTMSKWCGFDARTVINPDTEAFKKYAAIFYDCLQQVYGDVTNYYATDLFHENSTPSGVNLTTSAQNVLASMMEADEDAVWIIQAWQGNPKTALLNGLNVNGNRDHALVLDLYAERDPHYNDTSYGGSVEFGGTPWVFCMLNNFGGRLGLHGHLDNLANNIAQAANSTSKMKGVGITPEASQNNPILYDFIFETVWSDDGSLSAIDLDAWIEKYQERRYGAASDSALEALEIMKDTVYLSSNYPAGKNGQGAPENVGNARPATGLSAASTWGNAVITYDKTALEQALELLLTDYETLKDSDGYMYDLVTLAQQVLSNTIQEVYKKMTAALAAENAAEFDHWSSLMLEILDVSDTLLSTQKIYLFGNWTTMASALAESADDFTKDLYLLNAKSLVTTWGSYNQSVTGGLKDYSNRQWAGLTKDFYRQRWAMWIEENKKKLAGESYVNYTASSWFEFEWAYARSADAYTNVPSDANVKTLCQDILTSYLTTTLPKDPAADDSRDVVISSWSANSNSQWSSGGSSDNGQSAFDADDSTFWHSNKFTPSADESTHPALTMHLETSTLVDGVRYLPRQDSQNGALLAYKVYAGEDENSLSEVASGSFGYTPTDWTYISFEPVQAQVVKLVWMDGKADNSGNWATAAEVRVTAAAVSEGITLDTQLLSTAVAAMEQASLDKYSNAPSALAADIASARALINDALSKNESGTGTQDDQSAIDVRAKAMNQKWMALRLRSESDALSALSR